MLHVVSRVLPLGSFNWTTTFLEEVKDPHFMSSVPQRSWFPMNGGEAGKAGFLQIHSYDTSLDKGGGNVFERWVFKESLAESPAYQTCGLILIPNTLLSGSVFSHSKTRTFCFYIISAGLLWLLVKRKEEKLTASITFAAEELKSCYKQVHHKWSKWIGCSW